MCAISYEVSNGLSQGCRRGTARRSVCVWLVWVEGGVVSVGGGGGAIQGCCH